MQAPAWFWRGRKGQHETHGGCHYDGADHAGAEVTMLHGRYVVFRLGHLDYGIPLVLLFGLCLWGI